MNDKTELFHVQNRFENIEQNHIFKDVNLPYLFYLSFSYLE